MVTADKDSQTLFGNVTMANSAAYEQQLPSGSNFTSTLSGLPAHTELNSIGFTVAVNLVNPGEDANNIVFTITVDGQSVPVYVAWVQPGLASVSMNLSMLPHISDSAAIVVGVAEPGSSDTFGVSNEEVAADQDAWINPVQTESFRDSQQPAVLDLVRGDDSGTPQAPGRAQDIYFALGNGGYTAGLVNSDGSISPIDPNAAYADFGITLAGQNGGVTYDPNTGLFKTTIPANQSSVEVDFIPTNLFGPAGVNPILYQVDLQGTVTDPNTQIGFEFNAPVTPTTQVVVAPNQHGLVVTSPDNTDSETLQSLIDELNSEDPATRYAAQAALGALIASDPSLGLLQQLESELPGLNFSPQLYVESLIQQYYPLSPVIDENNNTMSITLPSSIPSGSDIYYRIVVDGKSWINAQILGGETPSYEYYTPAGETTGLPDIVLKPLFAGNYTISIYVTPYGPNGFVGDVITQNIAVTVLNT